MKYKQYPKYKDSGVEWIGEIPEGWEINKIKFNFKIKSGKTLQSSKKNEDDIQVPYITAGNVFWDKIEIDDLSMMNVSPEEIKMYQIQNGDLLVSEGGDSGRSAIVDKINFDCIIQNHVHRLRPLNGSSSGYLENVLRSIKESGWFDALTKRVTMNNLPSLILANIIMPVPSEKEQYEIYNFLQKKKIQFDELIVKSKAQITLLEEKRQATINQAVTKGLDPSVPMKDSGVEWIGEIPEGWEVKKLKQITKFSLGLVINPSNYFDENGKIPMITGKNVKLTGLDTSNSNLITEESNFNLKDSQIFFDDIVSMRVGDAGRSAVVNNSAHGINCASLIITRGSKNHNSNFICYIFNSPVGIAQTIMSQNGMAQQVVNLSSWKNFLIPLPLKEEQDLISEFLDKQTTQLDELIAKSKTQVTLLEEKRQALITAAVTGKIDVRGIAA